MRLLSDRTPKVKWACVYSTYWIVAAIVAASPTSESYGTSLRRSPIGMDTAPPVAWKKLPCGSESSTIAPAWIIAAADMAGTPAARSVPENVWEATVATAAPAAPVQKV